MTDPSPGRGRRAVPLLAAAGVLAVVVAGVLLAAHQQDTPERPAVTPLPPPSPGVVSAGYVGSHWRLTAVADRRGTTAIPATVDAWLELAADGEFLASDDVNTMNGRFTPTSAGFDVSDTITTLVGYDGNDPVRSAAVTGIGAMTFVPPAPSSSPSEAPPAHVTVLSADREHLVVQAAGVRLTFTRSGPASRLTADLPPVTGSADVPERHN